MLLNSMGIVFKMRFTASHTLMKMLLLLLLLPGGCVFVIIASMHQLIGRPLDVQLRVLMQRQVPWQRFHIIRLYHTNTTHTLCVLPRI